MQQGFCDQLSGQVSNPDLDSGSHHRQQVAYNPQFNHHRDRRRDYKCILYILLMVPVYSCYIPQCESIMSYNTCQLTLVMLEIGITPDFSITLAPMAHTYQTPKYRQFSCMHFRLHTDCRHETFYYMHPRFLVTL